MNVWFQFIPKKKHTHKYTNSKIRNTLLGNLSKTTTIDESEDYPSVPTSTVAFSLEFILIIISSNFKLYYLVFILFF